MHIIRECFQRTMGGSWTQVQFSLVPQSCPTLCNPMDCSTPGFLVHHQLPEFTQTHVHQVSDAIQPFHPLSSPSPPPSIFPSIGVFSNESVLHIRSFSFSISPSSEYSGLISFRMDWVDLLAVQGTLKSLLQHHRSNSRSVVSDFLRPHESHHARPPCPSPTPRVHSDSCPSSQ